MLGDEYSEPCRSLEGIPQACLWEVSNPKWQWNIIKALRTTFENVQFIIATHSPIVMSSAKEANIILLNRGLERKDFQ